MLWVLWVHESYFMQQVEVSPVTSQNCWRVSVDVNSSSVIYTRITKMIFEPPRTYRRCGSRRLGIHIPSSKSVTTACFNDAISMPLESHRTVRKWSLTSTVRRCRRTWQERTWRWIQLCCCWQLLSEVHQHHHVLQRMSRTYYKRGWRPGCRLHQLAWTKDGYTSKKYVVA